MGYCVTCRDLSHNKIASIHDHAFALLTNLTDLNVGVNDFSDFPSEGLQSLKHIKAHNNPNLQDFPSCTRFPNVKTLVLSYAYHCCQFMQETYQNSFPEYTNFDNQVLINQRP